jgi:hypothetical protein
MRYNSSDWLCKNMMKKQDADVAPARKEKPLIPLWALMLGPLWIPVLLAMLVVYSVVMVVWVIPVAVACEEFGWELPKGILPWWSGTSDDEAVQTKQSN